MARLATHGIAMDLDEVKYIVQVTKNRSPLFWGVICKHCGISYESGHLAYSFECVTPSGSSPTVMKGTFFSPPDSYVNPFAQTYAISLAAAGYTPPGDRKSTVGRSSAVVSLTEKKVYKGRCPCGCEVKCDYHEIIP